MGTIRLKPTDSMRTIKSALMKTGNTIIFEKGIYKVTETLYFNSNNVIKGNGQAKLRMSAPIHNILMTYTTPNTTGYNGVHDVIIDGIIIEQMYSRYGACKCNGITLWHANNITIQNCTIMDTIVFHGLEINGSSNVTVKNTKFTGYISDKNTDFREQSQIDFSSESAIFLHKSGSPCYDLTPCKNIKYVNCVFDKSVTSTGKTSRLGASWCIGNHCQPSQKKHTNIIIDGCKFYGYGTNNNGACVHLVAMDNVVIRNCYAEGFGMLVKMEDCKYSYSKNGKKLTVGNEDGVCSNIIIENNTVKNSTSTRTFGGVFCTSKNTHHHKNIVVKNNTFDDSKYGIYVNWIEGLSTENNNGKIYKGKNVK